MVGWLIYGVRYLGYGVGNLLRGLRRPSEYVSFLIEQAPSELPPPPAPFWQRWLTPAPPPSIQELRRAFSRLAADRRVKGAVILLTPSAALSFAGAQSLRAEIERLRAAGKRVVCWATSYSSVTYYAACAADQVLLQPVGAIQPLGATRGFLYLAEALERAGIEAQILQVSPYKSAGDIFTKRNMPPEVREMVGWLLVADFQELVGAVAAGRGLSDRAALLLVDGSPYTDQGALEARAVDAVVTEEELPQHLGTRKLSRWDLARGGVRLLPPDRPGRHVALIRIEGAIVDGRSSRPPLRPPVPVPLLVSEVAGDLSVVQHVRQAAASRRVAAAVLYVDSGGGSATASEAMAAALRALAAKKPLVVAMGTLAASGGYFVATPARWIVARPATLTGSIGVLTGKFVVGGLLGRLLFHHESVTRGEHADMFSPTRPFSDEERRLVKVQLDRIYEVFKQRVAEGRGERVGQVEPIAGGRVWTGSQALERGLVDQLGGLEEAISKARELARLGPRTPVREIRDWKRPLAPAPPAAAALEHALRALRLLDGRALLLSQLQPLE